MKGHVRVGQGGKQSRPPVRRHHHQRQPPGLQDQFLAPHLDLAPVDLIQQAIQVRRHQVDHPLGQGVLGGQAGRAAHRLLGPLGVAPTELGQAADVGRRIVDQLSLHGPAAAPLAVLVLGPIRRLQAPTEGQPATDLHRGRGTQVGGRGHGRHVGGVQDIGPRTGGPRTAGGHIADHRDRGAQDAMDDDAHGGIESPGGVQAQDHHPGPTGFRLPDSAVHEVRRRWPDGALEIDQQGTAPGLRGGNRRRPDEGEGQHQPPEQGVHGR